MLAASKNAAGFAGLKLLSAVWAIAVIAPLVYFPQPAVLVGHPWKVELIASTILAVFFAGFLLHRNERELSIASPLAFYVVAPVCAFIVWSGLSTFWAGSTLSVAHHTLVWCGYLAFFAAALFIASDKKLLKIAVLSLGAVLSVICLCCIVEFAFEEIINEAFGARYGRFAEIFAAALPLFFSFALRLKGKRLRLAAGATALLWLALLLANSRGALFSSVCGLAIFILLRIFSIKTATEKRRLVYAAAALISVVLLVQIGSFVDGNDKKSDAISRIVREDKNPGNTIAGNVRFLYAGVGREMFFDNYGRGVGADNFGLEFNRYRAVFSANAENKSAAGQQEESLPERAHNEYLQILAELGVVGGAIFLCLLAGIARLGFAEFVRSRFEPSNILTHAAIAGICAFLFNSMFSSFSFRLMQNGLVFFFLLAILLRNFVARPNTEKARPIRVSPTIRSRLASAALAACLALTIFSALKAASQFLVFKAESEANQDTAKSLYERAIRLDGANASAHFSYGMRLLGANDYAAAAAQLRLAKDKGVNDSVAYSYLISAQTLANRRDEILNTTAEAANIFPYSVFLRVRRAVALNKFGAADDAENEFKIAERLDGKRARTWRLLINDGLQKTSRATRADNDTELCDVNSLTPYQGFYAIIAERELLYPNEKTKFNF